MAIRDRNTLKAWFLKGMKPLAAQFADWMDSFWHKDEKIPITSVDNLASTLNSKANTSALNAHVANKNNPHEVKVEQIEGAVSVEQLQTETQNRVDGDSNLQGQIDDLASITTIRGNVDTHADLLTIDTANMRSGDSYIVEADETHDNKATIYAFDAQNSQWIYTGEWSTAADLSEYQKTAEKGVASGYAPLGADNKVPALHLPEMNSQNFANNDLTLTGNRSHKLGNYSLALEANDEFRNTLNFAVNSTSFSLSCATGVYEPNMDTSNLVSISERGCSMSSYAMGLGSSEFTLAAGEIECRLSNVRNKFTWFDDNGVLQYLTPEEFKAKLGL